MNDILIDAAATLLAGIEADGGATVDIHTGRTVNLTHGYVVSMAGYGWKYGLNCVPVTDPEFADWVQQYVNHAPEWIGSITSANPIYVGAWLDADTGIVYLDLSAVFTGREFALTVAREQGQVAIWDVVHGTDIRVDSDIDFSILSTYNFDKAGI